MDDPKVGTDLDDHLTDVQVDHPAAWSNDTGPKGFYAVSTGKQGILAYFAHENHAFFFRLALINARLNRLDSNGG